MRLPSLTRALMALCLIAPIIGHAQPVDGATRPVGKPLGESDESDESVVESFREPEYGTASCCTLCPRASDPSVYISQFLRDHRQLLQGKDDWLFYSAVELATGFTMEPLVMAELTRLTASLKARGTQVLILETPPRGVMHADRMQPGNQKRFDAALALANYRKDLEALRRAGFIVPDYGLLTEQRDGTEFYYRRDVHWTPEGAQRTAALIADTIKALPLYAGLRPQKFATHKAGTSRQAGVLSLAATQLCGGHYPWEVSSLYVTEPLDVDPFAEAPPPEVVLVGTSFSGTPDYNFSNFLQQSLQVVVQNVALSGGGPDGSISQYLVTEGFQANPPKLLIWEMSQLQKSSLSVGTLRRLLSLVDNGCAAQEVLLSNTVEVAAGGEFTDVLFNSGDQLIRNRSEELVVDLQFADPTVSEFLVEVWYLDGKHEVLRVCLNNFTRTAGRFALEMNRTAEFAQQPVIVVRVQMVSPLAKPTMVKASMCKVRSAGLTSASR